MTILVIIHPDIPDIDIFKASLNSNIEIVDANDMHYRIKYNEISNNTYERVGLVWHKKGDDRVPLVRMFKDRPDPDRLLKKKTFEKGAFFSNNLVNLMDLLKVQNENIELDLITCNYNKSKPLEYIVNYISEHNIIVNYSVDKTGNPDMGGDWIMENTNFNIKPIYFNDNIDNYNHVLASAGVIEITGANGTNLILTQAYLDANMGTGVDFIGNTITFSENINWDSSWQISVDSSTSTPIIIKGGGYTLTIDSDSSFDGLIDWATDDNTVTVQNLSITGGYIDSYDGFFFSDMDSYNGGVITVDNCHLLAGSTLDDDYAGGIGGNAFGKNAVTVIKNCSCRADIGSDSDPDGLGGMVGQEANDDGVMTIYNCYCTGDVYYQSGGMCGEYFCQDGGIGYIYDCYCTGIIAGNYAGGICGEDCGYDSGKVYITNCYSTGNITGDDTGGICGEYCGSSNGHVYITNCYSTGNITGEDAGGICGSKAGEDGDGDVIHVFNCYSSGEISGTNAGGIVGDGFGSNEAGWIIKCYSTGNISGSGAGGICGDNAGNYGNNGMIYGCYSTGNITGENSGGICGKSVDTNLSIYGCYASGTISGTNAGGICGNSSNLNYIENCYSTRSTYTSISSSQQIDGSSDTSLLSVTLPNRYGFRTLASDETYPKLTNFRRLPWSGYIIYTSNPTITLSAININDSFLDIIKINTLRSNLESDLSNYNIVFGNIRNSLVSSPYYTAWAFEIFSNNIGSESTALAIDDLTTAEKTAILSRFDTHYQDNVSSGISFSLYDGSVLVSNYNISCFDEYADVLTIDGYKSVKLLKVGDKLVTYKKHVTTIQEIGVFNHTGDICIIKQNRYGNNKPFKKIIITPDHKYKVNNKSRYPRDKCRILTINKPIKLYHIKTTNYHLDYIMVNGLALETWRT
jgi:hypothetical protein